MNSKTLTPQQAGQKAMRDGKAAGLTDDEIQIAMLEASLEAAPESAKARFGYSIDDDSIRLRVADEEGLTLSRNFSSLQDVQAQHSSLLDFMQSYKLTGEQSALNLSLAMFGMRSSVYSAENLERQSKLAFDDGVVTGLHKVRTATAQRNASFNGFRGDLMTREDWGYTIANQTRQWSQQNATSAMMFVAGVASVPLLAADLIAVGALAGRGAMALGRGVMSTADDMGRSLYASYQATGIRGTLLSAASPTTSWTTVQMGAMTTARSVASRPSALSTADVLHGVNSFAWRNPYNVYGSSIHAAKAIMANQNAQAGFVSGVTNTAVDYYINGDQATLGVSFVGGFIGGAFGSLAAQNLTSTIRPVVSGLIGGAVGEYMDQKLKGDEFNLVEIGISAATGVLATAGVNKLFKVNTTVTVIPPNPVHSTSAAMTGGFVGSYTNSELSDWYKKWFQ